ncbi:MAG: hypothetical protein JWO82_3126 [Akkermansiaceae bacterium]|nr:hypothetical protein [Akkermansiaceae bacterium]
MLPHKPDRPYLDSWLRRTRKQLAASGALTEMALLLAKAEGNTPAYWAGFVREVLDEEIVPSLDLLTRIDLLLAKPAKDRSISLDQPQLF